MLNVMVKPTGPLCNLNCQYCYYLNKKNTLEKENSFVMSDAILETFTKNYFKALPKNIPEIFFSWQGGEPTLLGIAFFEKVIHYQNKYNTNKLKVINSLQTNGTLLNSEWALFLQINHFLVGVSVDGPQNIHDFYRKNYSKGGSFKKVHQAIQCLNKYQVEYNTLTTVNNHNAEFPKEVYEYLKLTGSKWWQFIPIVNWQSNNLVSKESVQIGQYSHFINGIFDKWLAHHDYNKIWVQLFDTFIAECLGYPAQLCIFNQSCGNCLAMEHNGDVFSCDHYVDKDHLLGNIRNNSFIELIQQPNHLKFSKYKNNLPITCKKCKYLSFCYGGCPKHRSLEFEIPENYLCEDYQGIFKKTLPVFHKMAACIKMGLPKSPNGPSLPDQNTLMTRNTSCHCGSGKKLKNCCGSKNK